MLKTACHLAMTVLFGLLSAEAADLEQIQAAGAQKLVEAVRSQEKINTLVEGAEKRLLQYQNLQKQIEGLQSYNAQLILQVENQRHLIEYFDESFAQVVLIERQMLPLVTKMAESLRQFVALDLPFHNTERQDRVASIQENLLAADLDIAEKFRQVVEAYQIENEYGRTIDTYQSIVTLAGVSEEVDILRVGRIAILCQSKDTARSARWDSATQAWQILDNVTYRNAIRQGIKMAKKQASIDLLTLPIVAPEIAQ